MHDDFADWYRPCTAGTELNLTGDLLAKRWAGVEKAAIKPGQDVLDIVRLALGRLGGDGAFVGKFKAKFKEADAAFQMSGNDFELSLLAGSTLCRIFQQEGDEADEGALAVLSAAHISTVQESSEPFVSHAAAYLDRRLREIRKIPVVRPPQISTKKLKQLFETFAVKLTENNPANTSEAAKPLFETMLQTMTAAVDATATAVDQLDRQSDLRREETDVLWWLTAGVSRDLNETFKQMKPPAASIIAGKELADLVNPPGILPAKSILLSIVPPVTGRAAKTIALHTAVNATAREWRERVAKTTGLDQVADLCPVLAAVKHSLTTDEEDAWTPAYKKAFCVDPKSALEPVELAHQVYRECLLARLAAEQ